jgi:hypothetical protein
MKGITEVDTSHVRIKKREKKEGKAIPVTGLGGSLG